MGGGNGAAVDTAAGLFVAKLQAPLDNSDDARGGMGPMTPTTLLLSCPDRGIAREIDEDEQGHTALARLAIRHSSTVYVYAECHAADHSLSVYTGTLPPQVYQF